MSRALGIIFGVLLLAVIGGICLVAGFFERRMAVAQEDMVVLDFVDPQADYVLLEQQAQKWPLVSSGPLKEIKRRRALIQYWQHDYRDLVEISRVSASDAEPKDPDIQMMAANALYRVAQKGPQDKATVVQNLDAAVKAYAEALRAGADRPDAAFNYELAVRLRDEISNGKRKGGMPQSREDDAESDPNMHGDPGEPPKEMKVEQFQIRIPMDPREIKQGQEESAGTGPQRKRKG